MESKKIETKAQEILRELNVADYPIDIENIAEQRGLSLLASDLGGTVSGLLIIDGHSGTIGYNSKQSEVRRRFTIAHELGHYELHRRQEEIFVDHPRVLFRSDNILGDPEQERQANAFAAAILMPKDYLRKAIDSLEIDVDDEDAITQLATKFKVSNQAMTFRLMNLGFIRL